MADRGPLADLGLFPVEEGVNSSSAPSLAQVPAIRSGNWSAAYQKERAFVANLTLLEKINLTTGVEWQ